MLVRVGSMQTNDELWINPEHVIYVRVQRAGRTAVIKLSDGTTHTIKTRSDVPVIEADALKLLHGRSSARLTELLTMDASTEDQKIPHRTSA